MDNYIFLLLLFEWDRNSVSPYPMNFFSLDCKPHPVLETSQAIISFISSFMALELLLCLSMIASPVACSCASLAYNKILRIIAFPFNGVFAQVIFLSNDLMIFIKSTH